MDIVMMSSSSLASSSSFDIRSSSVSASEEPTATTTTTTNKLLASTKGAISNKCSYLTRKQHYHHNQQNSGQESPAGKFTPYTFDANEQQASTCQSESHRPSERSKENDKDLEESPPDEITNEPNKKSSENANKRQIKIQRNNTTTSNSNRQQLSNLMRFCIQIIILLITFHQSSFVPSNLVNCLQQQQQQQQQQSVSGNSIQFLNNHHQQQPLQFQHQNQHDWAKRLTIKPEQPSDLISNNQQLTNRQSLERPARQSFLTEFVSQQSQRFLANLSPMGAANHQQDNHQQSILNQHQHQQPIRFLTGQLNQQQAPKQPTGVAGKLYNFLFPNNPIIPNQPALQIIQPSNQLTEVSSNDTGKRVVEKQLISLNAPYEHRPRPAQMTNATLSSSLARRGSRSQPNNSDTMKEPRAGDGSTMYTESSSSSSSTGDENGLGEQEGTYGEPTMSLENSQELANEGELQASAGQQGDQIDEPQVTLDQGEQQVATGPEQEYAGDQTATQINGETPVEEIESTRIQPANNTENIVSSQDGMSSLLNEFSNENLAQPNFRNILPLESNQTGIEQTTTDTNLVTEGTPSVAGVADESFLAAQLPSQYDAVIRLPPEGYYDDYYQLKASTSKLLPLGQIAAPQVDSLAGEFSMQQIVSPEHQATSGDQFEIVESTNRSQNHNYQPPTQSIDYTKDFFLAQGPLKQTLSNSDQEVEFLTTNRQNYTARPKVGASEFESSPTSNNNKNALEESSYRVDKPTRIPDSYTRPPANDSTHSFGKYQGGQEDSIQLILANTSPNQRDPLNNNEKLINYVDEQRGTRTVGGKPARQTFVNKDMNEYPAGLGDSGQPVSAPGDRIYKNQANQTSGDYNNQGENQILRGEAEAEGNQTDGDEAELRRVTSKAPEGLNYGRYNNDQNPMPANGHSNSQQDWSSNAHDEPTPPSPTNKRDIQPEATPNSSHHKSHQRNSRSDNRYRDVRERPEGHNRYQAQRHYDRKPAYIHQTELRPIRPGRHAHRPIARRPQVTQVNFEPKQLVLGPPTPSPDESAIDAVADLPQKVKKIKDRQPDKNELMNELLTALDRVKVAIYKLQPLTAKMNAIYRKSVTSNTRDIIMDHHKGTYAKRYPPGDYDDSYDRMKPNEYLDRQQAASSRNARGQRSGRSSRSSSNIDSRNQPLDSSESNPNAVYLAAPRELLDNFVRNKSSSFLKPYEEAGGEASLVATGVGRRLGNGCISGLLELSSTGDTSFHDSQRIQIQRRSNESTLRNSNNSILEFPSNFGGEQEPEDEGESPLFGYRITIFQSPEDPEDQFAQSTTNPEQFSYKIDGLSGNIVENFSQPTTVSPDDEPTDSMITSESTVNESTLLPASQMMNANETTSNYELDNEGSDDDGSSDEEVMEGSESGKKKKKMLEEMEEGDGMEKKKKHGKKKAHEEGHQKKAGKEEAEEKKEHKKKAQSRKKKNEEESKKKKEYKKIKHNKGILSKEKKTMHRDKHIKAHDRGAAKEKALKERTQIEFFEREQIVDDEFEKGKKSTVKAAWQSGHDSKKSHKDLGAGDAMKMDGSHNIKHYATKGHGMEQEASSGKKSNKYEKKAAEAKGKKFKGWREKGYKIITETEFIDRGSLHDSAYKKRDKGAAQHKKFKKQEVSSEGHHGSMNEHHKKLHKKEEEKLKEAEKKEMEKKKELKEKKGKKEEKKEEKNVDEEMEKKHKKKKHHRHHKQHKKHHNDHEEAYEESLIATTVEPLSPTNNINNTNSNNGGGDLSKYQRSVHMPITLLQSSGSSPEVATTMRPSYLVANHTSDRGTLQRLMNLNSEDHNHQDPNEDQTVSKLLGNINYSLDDFVSRRSDAPTQNSIRQSLTNGSTILDIVDNLTGRQVNKTKIGTYELDDHHTIKLNSTGSGASTAGSSLLKVGSSLAAKLFPSFSMNPQHQQTVPNNSTISRQARGGPPLPMMMISTTTSTTSTTTTRRPQLPAATSAKATKSPAAELAQARDNSDAAIFLDLFERQFRQQQSSEEASSSKANINKKEAPEEFASGNAFSRSMSPIPTIQQHQSHNLDLPAAQLLQLVQQQAAADNQARGFFEQQQQGIANPNNNLEHFFQVQRAPHASQTMAFLNNQPVNDGLQQFMAATAMANQQNQQLQQVRSMGGGGLFAIHPGMQQTVLAADSFSGLDYETDFGVAGSSQHSIVSSLPHKQHNPMIHPMRS